MPFALDRFVDLSDDRATRWEATEACCRLCGFLWMAVRPHPYVAVVNECPACRELPMTERRN